jgi:soluble lytic murein transglycosylase-like protein
MKRINPKTAVFFWFLCVFAVMGFVFHKIERTEEEKQEQYLEQLGLEPSAPVCLQMYSCIEKYSEKYRVPRHIAFNVAFRETRYQGPFHWSYTTNHKSHSGAVGPMQIITKYSHRFAGRHVTETELMTNVDLNVSVSMKMLRKWFEVYRDWGKACGAYNTGSPVLNDYAMYCLNNKNYKKNWVGPKN